MNIKCARLYQAMAAEGTVPAIPEGGGWQNYAAIYGGQGMEQQTFVASSGTAPMSVTMNDSPAVRQAPMSSNQPMTTNNLMGAFPDIGALAYPAPPQTSSASLNDSASDLFCQLNRWVNANPLLAAGMVIVAALAIGGKKGR